MPDGSAIDDTALRREAERLLHQLRRLKPVFAMADHAMEKKLGLSYLVEVRVGRDRSSGVNVVLDAATSQEQTLLSDSTRPYYPDAPHDD